LEGLGPFGASVLRVRVVSPVLQGRDGSVLRRAVSLFLSTACPGLAALFSGL
jgi:hypothetical protein